MDAKQVIGTIVIVIAVALFGWLYFSGSESTSNQQSNSTQNNNTQTSSNVAQQTVVNIGKQRRSWTITSSGTQIFLKEGWTAYPIDGDYDIYNSSGVCISHDGPNKVVHAGYQPTDTYTFVSRGGHKVDTID
ncbi:MAG: hypothetical protein NTW62_01875 [Candidatus Nomurabacteria bacterium]|nr:hypothetical protein [Candidatus Nomurabacteria bacterium]